MPAVQFSVGFTSLTYGDGSLSLLQVWCEEPQSRGAVNFITGMGGFLQAIIFGYCGARLQPDRLVLDPQLPPTVQRISVSGTSCAVLRASFIMCVPQFARSAPTICVDLLSVAPCCVALPLTWGMKCACGCPSRSGLPWSVAGRNHRRALCDNFEDYRWPGQAHSTITGIL